MTRVRVVRRDTDRRRALMRRAVFVVAVAVPISIALTVLLGLGVSASVGCGTCHAEHVAVETRAKTVHGSLECGVCHAQSGVAGTLSDGARAVGWFRSAMFGAQVHAVSGDDQRCLGCHESIVEGVVVNRGVAVRHSDFLATPCGFCHEGTGHRISTHVYKGPEMDDCLTCHRTAEGNLGSCEGCHPDDGNDERGPNQTAWQVTHGDNWEQAHGLGDLNTCASCHDQGFCVSCHQVRVPHPADWQNLHGNGLDDTIRQSCATCHEETWCADCHRGVEMPHPSTFLPVHGPEADRLGAETCSRCHDERACDECHFRSAHPNVPGVAGPHGG